ncbi:MAG: lipoyl synthase [Bradymonadaceae bacterium]
MSKKISLPIAGRTPEARASERVSGPARPALKFQPDEAGPRPRWIRKRLTLKKDFFETQELVRTAGLNTICESGQCPNITECWSRRSLTFMILGNICTRSCGFCDVQTGRPGMPDADEPRRVAAALAGLDLNYVVITSVDRDDLEDGGARHWADTIRAIKESCPTLGLEVLTPDFKGEMENVDIVLDAMPDCFAHNIETVEAMHRVVRPQATYERSLLTLGHAARHGRSLVKSGLMLGLGETTEQIVETMGDLVDVGCEVLNLGQYLRPSPRHLPLKRWVHPDEFAFLKEEGERLGFKHVESGPLVRSSYRADLQAEEISRKDKNAFSGCGSQLANSSK